jgi:hypothetical protein
LGDGDGTTRIRRTRRARLLVRNPRLLPGLVQRGGWSNGILQGVLDAVLRDGFEARGRAAFPLVCVEGLGDLAGEASKLEEVGRLGNSLPWFGRRTGGLAWG